MTEQLRRLQEHLHGTTSLYAGIVHKKKEVKEPVFVRISGNARITFKGSSTVLSGDRKCVRTINGKSGIRTCNRNAKRGFEYCIRCLDMPTVQKTLEDVQIVEELVSCKYTIAQGKPNERPCPGQTTNKHGYCDKCVNILSVKRILGL